MLSPGRLRIGEGIVTRIESYGTGRTLVDIGSDRFSGGVCLHERNWKRNGKGSIHLALVRPVSRSRFWLERWMGVTALAWMNAALMLGL